jgi:hypothetical protein
LITGLLLFLFYRLVNNADQAGLFTSIIIFFLFYYGIFYSGFRRRQLFETEGYYHILSIGVFIILIAALIRINKIKRPKFLKIFTLFLNIMAIFVIITPLISYIRFIQANLKDPLRNWEPTVYDDNIPSYRMNTNHPDIYYVILDGYGGEDVLSSIYNFDNSDFLEYLQDRGFYIADESRSNYLQTALSLASSLNVDYLDDLNQSGSNSWNRSPLKDLIANSRVNQILSDIGYSFITFDTGYDFTDIEDSDLYFSNFINIEKFEEVYLSFTPLLLFDNASWNKIPLFTYQTHRSRIQDINEQFSLIPSLPGPKFVFVHYLIPHPPFVFDRFGNSIYPDWSYSLKDADSFPGSRAEYIAGYTEQIQYVNKMVIDLVDGILSNSENQPLIIIQGDHGSRMLTDWSSPEASCTWESASILNAFLVEDSSSLYPSITPVNTFRIILDDLANTNFSLLEDKVFFSDFGRPYNFIDITELSEIACLQ